MFSQQEIKKLLNTPFLTQMQKLYSKFDNVQSIGNELSNIYLC